MTSARSMVNAVSPLKTQSSRSRSTSAGSGSSSLEEAQARLPKARRPIPQQLQDLEYPFTLRDSGSSSTGRELYYFPSSPFVVSNTPMGGPSLDQGTPSSLDAFLQDKKIHPRSPCMIGPPPGLGPPDARNQADSCRSPLISEQRLYNDDIPGNMFMHPGSNVGLTSPGSLTSEMEEALGGEMSIKVSHKACFGRLPTSPTTPVTSVGTTASPASSASVAELASQDGGTPLGVLRTRGSAVLSRLGVMDEQLVMARGGAPLATTPPHRSPATMPGEWIQPVQAPVQTQVLSTSVVQPVVAPVLPVVQPVLGTTVDTPRSPTFATDAPRSPHFAMPADALVREPARVAQPPLLEAKTWPNSPTTPEQSGREAPSVGSKGHRFGTCRPCAFIHTKGCTSGSLCQYCHLCAPGERKRRQRQRLARAAQAQNLQMGT